MVTLPSLCAALALVAVSTFTETVSVTTGLRGDFNRLKLTGVVTVSSLAAIVSQGKTVVVTYRNTAKLADGLVRASAPKKSKKD